MAEPDWCDRYQRELGAVLRSARRVRRWTRKNLQHHLGGDVSLPTLGSYEYGTRRISVTRMAEIARAMGVPPADLIAETDARVFGKLDDRVPETGWTIDLAGASRLRGSRFRPLREWATTRLAQGAERTVRLDGFAMEALGVLCDLSRAELLLRLPLVVPEAGSAGQGRGPGWQVGQK